MKEKGWQIKLEGPLEKSSQIRAIARRWPPAGGIAGENLNGVASDVARCLHRFHRVGMEGHMTTKTHGLCSFFRLVVQYFRSRQLIQAGQAELLEEFGRGREEGGPSNRVRPSNLHHHSMLNQADKGAVAVAAAHRLDLRARNRL